MEWYELLLILVAFWGGYVLADCKRQDEIDEISDMLDEALQALTRRAE